MMFPMTRYLKKANFGFFWNISSNLATQAETAVKVDKTLLSKLRKKTGFSFFKCNNALKLANNNFEQAEKWLIEQAESEGWAKAEKLRGRSTNSGLIGVTVEDNYVSLVQVVCETDFVARNELFQELVSLASQATLDFRRNVIMQNMRVNSFSDNNVTHLRELLLTHEIQKLLIPNGNTTLEEFLVGVVGKIGENMQVKKALAIATNRENIIGLATHGNISTTLNNCVMGTYGAAVVLKPLRSNVDKSSASILANSLSQHVIGMNPKCLARNSDIPEEDTLLCQEYLLDSRKNIEDLVKEADVEIVDFVRYGTDE